MMLSLILEQKNESPDQWVFLRTFYTQNSIKTFDGKEVV